MNQQDTRDLPDPLCYLTFDGDGQFGTWTEAMQGQGTAVYAESVVRRLLADRESRVPSDAEIEEAWDASYKSCGLHNLNRVKATVRVLLTPSTSAAIPAPAATAEHLQAEIERLKACLQWYAKGEHYVLSGWDDAEPGWLNPPTDDSWMVEDGGVAKIVLEGGHMVLDNDLIAEELMTPAVHAEKLAKVERLLASNPESDSYEGRTLEHLAEEVERYEKRMFRIAAPAAPASPEARDALDAKRYRLLRNQEHTTTGVPFIGCADHAFDFEGKQLVGAEADATVDAAMAASKEPQA